MATSGGKKALGPPARGLGKALEALRQKALGPLADDRPLDPDHLSHVGLGVSRGQQEDDSPPPHEPSGNRGRTLPVLQGVAFLGGQGNAQ